MKVLDLRCAQGHRFEGWFASNDDLATQRERGLLACPMCGDADVQRLPSAPRLSRSSSSKPIETTLALPAPDDPQAKWLRAVRKVMANTEDVGERFPEEARRIHYGEVPARGIRGQASPSEAQAMAEEGIEVMALPTPPALKGTLQ
ncbi:MAG TPA: DUF1178 family protein [Burkholderiaceae bacterium]|nr:DUF1178 family protein [Burkholderiaceae bacterium]